MKQNESEKKKIHVLRFMEWGNCISIIEPKDGNDYSGLAFSKTTVSVNDLICAEVNANGFSVFRVKEVSYMSNPADMFEFLMTWIPKEELIPIKDELMVAIEKKNRESYRSGPK